MDNGSYTGFDVNVEKPGIAWIEFNEPERLNGMNSGKKRDLIEILTQAQMDNAVRVVVFIGTGRGFCAGDDLKAYSTRERDDQACRAQWRRRCGACCAKLFSRRFRRRS